MNSKLLSLMGLAKRANRASVGHDAVIEELRRKRLKLVIIATDASQRLEDEFRREKEMAGSDAEIIRIKQTMDEIRQALPSRAGVIGINDNGFARKMIQLIKED